jgi:methionine synthase I (cobalamin-dependent)
MEKVNVEAAKLAREACPAGKLRGRRYRPTGKLMKPLGDLAPEEAEEAFFMQAQALLKGGVDLISIETMFSSRRRLPPFVPPRGWVASWLSLRSLTTKPRKVSSP